jgi:hypothetical protein
VQILLPFLRGFKEMWSFKRLFVLSLLLATPVSGYSAPLSSCTFYKPNLLAQTFTNGAPRMGCAEFSAVLGRRGCRKVKGTCPLCVRYPGDHLQMWLPDYFIEVTKHVGKSIFTSLPTGPLLSKQLSLAQAWTDQAVVAPSSAVLSNGAHSTSGSSSFWHARIITAPYGVEVNNYPPLRTPSGTGFPHCFSAISEFYPSQWQLNLVDGPFALAWMPLGLTLCNNPAAQITAELMAQAQKNLSSALPPQQSVQAMSICRLLHALCQLVPRKAALKMPCPLPMPFPHLKIP